MTTKRRTPDASDLVAGDDLDLDEEPITLPDGTVLDEAAAEKYGREVADRAAAKRAGRPSLSGGGKHSPAITARVSEATHARLAARAKAEGKRVSDVIREAIEHYV